MATIWQFLFVIGQFKKSSLKPIGQINWNFVGSTYEKLCINFPQNKITSKRHRLSPLNLYVVLNMYLVGHFVLEIKHLSSSDASTKCIYFSCQWVSEWLLFLTPTQQYFSYIMGEQVNFQWDDEEVRFVHWQNSLRVDMWLHWDTLFWFRTNQSWLSLLNGACLAEKQQI